MEKCRYLMVNTTGVFTTQSNIYDGAFLQKQPTASIRWLFFEKNYIVVRLVSKHTSEYNHNFFPDVSKVKLMIFFQGLTFPTNTCQRPIQNAVQHLRWNIFAKIVNNFQSLTIFPKGSIIDVRLGSKQASLAALHNGRYFWSYG